MRSTTRTIRLAIASLTVATSTVALGAVATPAAAAPVPASSTAGQYVVKANDTLFDIARALEVSLASLLSTNGLTAQSTIHPGMVLLVPAGATVPAATSNPQSTPAASASSASSAPAGTYVVQRNDSIFAIAQKHGLKMGPLMKANNLTIDSMLVPGRTLTIPAGGTLVVSPAPASSGPATPAPVTPVPAGPAPAPAGTYVIVTGDSIFAIAQKHGLKMGPLMKANGLTTTSTLVPGRTLTIPAGGTTPAPAAPATPATPAAPATETPAVQAKLDTVVAYARAQLGKPWAFATAGPDTFDCSGLTMMAYRQIGISLPHSSVLQSTKGVAVDWFTQDIQAGDLIFMATSDAPGTIGHVGIAIDSKRWIHSPRAGDVVRQGIIPADTRLLAVRRYVTG